MKNRFWFVDWVRSEGQVRLSLFKLIFDLLNFKLLSIDSLNFFVWNNNLKYKINSGQNDH